MNEARRVPIFSLQARQVLIRLMSYPQRATAWNRIFFCFLVEKTWLVEQWRALVVFRSYAPLQSLAKERKLHVQWVRSWLFTGKILQLLYHWISRNSSYPMYLTKQFWQERHLYLKGLIQSKYCITIDPGVTWIFSA